MPGLADHHLEILKLELRTNYVLHLPPLLAGNNASPAQQAEKQVARAFAAFVLTKHLDVAPNVAAQSVVDDFNDNGVDAIWYEAKTETLFLVQVKLRTGEQFAQDDALAFAAGVRLLIKQDYQTFNANVLARQAEIEAAFGACSKIKLVVGYAGPGISLHANTALEQLIAEVADDDERLTGPVQLFVPDDIVAALQEQQAYKSVNAELRLTHHAKLKEPRTTHYGVVRVKDLVALHLQHGKGLYERNIRYFLGSRNSRVNRDIQDTLTNDPQSFLYLNNGVTALCGSIDPKGNDGSGDKRLKILGLSIINGAQTVASAAELAQQPSPPDISGAKVFMTLIKANPEGEFGSRVTRARNNQNPVAVANFASLDPQQERLRQELAYYQISYHYRPEATAASDAQNIVLQEAITALAWLQPDPRFAVWLKNSPASINDAESENYKALFSPGVTGVALANAVFYARSIQQLLRSAEWSTSGAERLIYRHGVNALGWVFAKRLRSRIEQGQLLAANQTTQNISQPFDVLRQQGVDKFGAMQSGRGPLSFFRNQTSSIPYLASLMEEHFGLGNHQAMPALKVAAANEAFPQERLFKFMRQQAPQI